MEFQNIFDTHAHYVDPCFETDQQELLTSLPGKGVSLVMEAGCSMESSRQGIALSRECPYIYCAVGIHPQDAGTVSREDGYLDELAELALARDLNLPVIIHNREAHADSLALIARYRPKGVFHCFSGSKEMAKELVKLGMYLGFTGVLTFSNARRALEAVKEIPMDRLLLETDCPFIAPAPFRGQRCDSSMIPLHAQKMAELKGVSVQEILDITNENGRRLFGIEAD